MDWDDLSDDVNSLRRAQEDIERMSNACDADPMNGEKHRLYIVHARQQAERLQQFIDEVIRLQQ
jgi:hypothetical protein